MAARARSEDDPPDTDLQARIQARVAERRATRQPADASPGSPASGQPDGAGPVVGQPVVVPARQPGEDGPPPGTGGPQRRTRRSSRLVHAFGFILAVLVTVVALRTFVVASYYIPSASMEPTLHGCPHCEPDLVVVDKLSYRFGSVARSDVVVFNRPPLAPPEDAQLIKRVIGLPGETISGHGGRVFVGSRALSEPYLNPVCGGTADFAAVRVPPGEYFMMGDNRCDSLDSRVFGVIPGSSIVGRAVGVSWPIKHLRWL